MSLVAFSLWPSRWLVVAYVLCFGTMIALALSACDNKPPQQAAPAAPPVTVVTSLPP